MKDIDTTNMRRLDFTLLLIFRDLIRTGRATSVAARLGLSQSAVSHALARLRHIFGDELFLRRPNGLEPTQRALELAPKIEAALTIIGDVLESIELFDPSTTQRLFRLAANDFVGTLLTGPLAKALRRDAPEAKVSITFAVGRESLDAINRNEVDLAIGRFDHIPVSFEAMPLFEEGFVVVARNGHPIIKQPFDLDTYMSAAHVLVSFRGGFDGMVDLALKKKGLSRRVVVSVSMFMAALAAVAESDLVATVPIRLASRYAKRFGLAMFTPPLAIPSFSISCIRHSRSRNDKAIDWLQDRIRTIFE